MVVCAGIDDVFKVKGLQLEMNTRLVGLGIELVCHAVSNIFVCGGYAFCSTFGIDFGVHHVLEKSSVCAVRVAVKRSPVGISKKLIRASACRAFYNCC